MHLSKAQLQHLENQSIQQQIIAQSKARIRNRHSINIGGPIEVEIAYQKKKAKEQKERDKAIYKVQKAINDDIQKSKKALNHRGIEARKAKRQHRKDLFELTAKGKFIPLELFNPINDPEKNLILDDLESL